MKIITRRDEQSPECTIDLHGLFHPYAIRAAIELALEIDGYSKRTIDEVFGVMPETEGI